jgi:hypothetical protein
MLGFNSEALLLNPEVLLLWIAAAAAGVLVVAFALALARPRAEIGNSLTRTGAIVFVAALTAAMGWAYINHANLRDHDVERRALELRAQILNASALAPGSPLTCLDAMTGDAVEAACEKALFAAPASVAAATAYIAARMTLLADMVAYTKRGGENLDDVLVPLRRSLETDRFGFLAHVLEVRDGCTSMSCKPLALLRDPGRVRTNLGEETLDRYIDHYATAWAQDAAVADATPAEPAAAPQAPQPPHKIVNIDFPTAASIPPVSIMNPEQTKPAAVAANGGAPAAGGSRRSRKPSAPAQAAAATPAPDPVDPVWTPAPSATASAPTAPAPAATAPQSAPSPAPVPAAAAPVQLNPFPAAPPQASAGGAVRAQ